MSRKPEAPADPASFTKKDLLDIESLSKAEIQMILDTADSMAEINKRTIKKVPTLRGRLVANLFYENSTRTRFSFEIAERRLTADSISFAAATSSASKGETLLDTCRNLEAMAPDAIVIRHQASGAPHFLARHLKCAVINAGDGTHAHPTQALLDAFTMRRVKGKLEGLRVAICGDVRFSRVARSNLALLPEDGSRGDARRAPHPPAAGDRTDRRPRHDADRGSDRRCRRRHDAARSEGARGGLGFPSDREYYEFFGLTPQRRKLARKDAIVMHPGPMNRGVEIDSAVADGPGSVILDQVEAGVAVRMAVLYLLIGATGDE